MKHRTRGSRRRSAPGSSTPNSGDRSRLLRLAVAGTGAAVAAALAGQPAAQALPDAPSAAAGGQHARSGAGEALASLKQSLRPYQDVSVALGDGFVPVSACTESPEGGMGVHYLNPTRAAQPVDPSSPAVLLYQPAQDGGPRLVGAEWFQADADQDLTTDQDRPTLWGRPFEGPMPGHDPGMPAHYDMHVWLYDSNPAGVFAAWNTSISC